MSPRPLLLVAFAALLLPPLSAQDATLTGTWRAHSWMRYGQERPQSFRFLTFDANGSVTISNGVETLPCWAKYASGTIQLQNTGANVWQDAPESELVQGGYQINDDGELQIMSPPLGRAVSFEPAALAKADWALTFKRVADEAVATLGPAGREPKLQAALENLARLGAQFEVDDLGKVTGINLSDSSATTDHLKALAELPRLGTVVVGSLDQAEEYTKTHPKLKFTALGAVERHNWQLRDGTAAGKAFDEGRRIRAALKMPAPAPDAPPVLISSSGVPAVVLPIKGKLFAIHPRFPAKAELPSTLNHPKLATPIRLGKVILSRSDFQVRQVTSKLDRKWSFNPIPKEAAVLYDGLHLEVCLPDRTLDAFVNVSKVNKFDRIVPGSPVDGRTVQGLLIMDPKGDVSTLGGHPVIDARTKHLVGFVAHAVRDVTECQFTLDPIHDLIRLPAPASAYRDSNFFNLGKARLARGQAAKLAGIFPPDILALKFGVTPAADFLNKRPNVLYKDREEFLGREYLFSRIRVQNRTPITVADATGKRIRLGDPRVRQFAEFLVSVYGEPTELQAGPPMGKTHEIVSLSWKKPNAGLRLDIAFSKLDNALNVTLWLEALKSPTLSGGFGVKKLEKKTSSRKLLDDFFKHLEKLPQDPRPRISRMEVIRKALEKLR